MMGRQGESLEIATGWDANQPRRHGEAIKLARLFTLDAERNRRIKVLQIVVSRSTNSQGLAIWRAALSWHFDFLVAPQICTGE